MRIGIGYDVHRVGGKQPLRLGGVAIPSKKGLVGHSDADALLHALADALFGAIGAPDLGEQFPPTDARYRQADSRQFVRAALQQVRHQGYTIGNVDATVVADAPRLTPYKSQMCQTIGRLLRIASTRVSVKATTTEGLPPGRRGIAAHVVVLIIPRNGRS